MDKDISSITVYKTMFEEYPDIVGVQEICKMLGIGETKAYRMINDGTLRRIPCSRTHKVAKITVIDYVLQCAQK